MNHRFQDREWVENYANTVTDRRPERIEMFDHIVAQIGLLDKPTASIVELASGPGLLAEKILDELPGVQYLELDYSEEMNRFAENATAKHESRRAFCHIDLLAESWDDILPGDHDAIISNMALHDLGTPELVESIYRQAKGKLRPGGLFLNAELVVASDHSEATQDGKFKVPRHREALEQLGYNKVTVPLDFGHYACIQGHRPVT